MSENNMRTCFSCDGKCKIDYGYGLEDCSTCNGTGEVEQGCYCNAYCSCECCCGAWDDHTCDCNNFSEHDGEWECEHFED